VVEAGWNLNELHAAGLSLEEIFLELTTSSESQPNEEAAAPVPEPVGEPK
jgi:hypothetical protein